MEHLKINTILGVMFAACMLFASCDEKKSFPDDKHLNVDRERVMGYVLCPEDTVCYLLRIADTIYSQRDKYTSLEMLDFCYEDWNQSSDALYGDTIPLVVSLFATYDAVTTAVSDDVSAVFVWHEVAKRQITAFMGKEPSKADVESIFKVIDFILECYAGGNQPDMNNVAWRYVMLADYRLADAYINVMDKYDDKEIVSLVHASYQNVMDSYSEIANNVTETYSDLPRQMGVTMYTLMEERRLEVKKIKSQDIGEVKKILKPHKMDAGLQDGF